MEDESPASERNYNTPGIVHKQRTLSSIAPLPIIQILCNY